MYFNKVFFFFFCFFFCLAQISFSFGPSSHTTINIYINYCHGFTKLRIAYAIPRRAHPRPYLRQPHVRIDFGVQFLRLGPFLSSCEGSANNTWPTSSPR